MQYLIQNTTPLSATDGSYTGSKTIWVEGSAQGNCFPLGPQETLVVSDTALDLLQRTFPTYINVIGTFTDDDAPISKTVALSGTWTLVTLGKFCTTFKFNTVATDCQVSFSGWNTAASETAPAADKIIPIPANAAAPGGSLFSVDMTMNASKVLYVKGTGSLTILGI